MCGIAGIYRPERDVSDATLRQFVSSLHHRGPDGSEIWTEPGIGLCHTRLAILDLSSLATQPMTSHNGRYVITYNGEIFNFRELREKLERVGTKIRSTGDTEVLLEYLVHFGLDALGDLEGQFAFALWDRHERTLTFARDRHGIKPLYYAIAGDAVYFASETKTLLDVAQPDHASIDAILLGLPCTWGERTPYRNVHGVRPGEVVVVDRNLAVASRQFYSLAHFVDAELYREFDQLPRAEVLKRVETVLNESVDLQMVSDAPLACLVSGGVDSCLISALAHARVATVGLFHANVVSDSETPAARQAAEFLNSTLHVAEVPDQLFIELMPEVTFANDLPTTYHPNSIPFYVVCKLAHEHGIKVLLTGEGSDEYFLGYAMSVVPYSVLGPCMKLATSSRQLSFKVFSKLFPQAMRLFWPTSDTIVPLFRGLVNRYESTIIHDMAQNAFPHISNDRERSALATTMSLIEAHLSSLLHRNDRLGMAWSLESRFPFLGHAVARMAVNLPSRYKMHPSWRIHDTKHPFLIDKWCVRHASEKVLPHELAYRRKWGFHVNAYLRLQVSEQYFHDGFIADWYRLPSAAIKRLVEASTPVWLMRLLMVDVWGRLFVQRQSIAEVVQIIQNHVKVRPLPA